MGWTRGRKCHHIYIFTHILFMINILEFAPKKYLCYNLPVFHADVLLDHCLLVDAVHGDPIE